MSCRRDGRCSTNNMFFIYICRNKEAFFWNFCVKAGNFLYHKGCHLNAAIKIDKLILKTTNFWSKKLLLSWPRMRSASGWGSFWESSSFVPWLIINAIPEGSGVVPERPGSSGFIRKSSSQASAPRILFCVLLNSFDNLFVTLPSISSETWDMYSSCDLGAPEFCAKLDPGCSSQFSLFSAANFLLFRVVISLRKSNDQSVILYYLSWNEKTIWF